MKDRIVLEIIERSFIIRKGYIIKRLFNVYRKIFGTCSYGG